MISPLRHLSSSGGAEGGQDALPGPARSSPSKPESAGPEGGVVAGSPGGRPSEQCRPWVESEGTHIEGDDVSFEGGGGGGDGESQSSSEGEGQAPLLASLCQLLIYSCSFPRLLMTLAHCRWRWSSLRRRPQDTKR